MEKKRGFRSSFRLPFKDAVLDGSCLSQAEPMVLVGLDPAGSTMSFSRKD
jgi:hypothetical protein